jgi:hypothetical protein
VSFISSRKFMSFISSRKFMLLKWLSFPLFHVKNVSTQLLVHSSHLLIRQCLKCHDTPIMIHMHNITFLYYIYISHKAYSKYTVMCSYFYGALMLLLANILSAVLWSMSSHTGFKSHTNHPLFAMWTGKYSAILFDEHKSIHVH